VPGLDKISSYDALALIPLIND